MQEQAAKQVSRVAGEQLASLLGEGGAAAYGDSIIRYKKRRTERCIDPDGFTDYLTVEVKGDRVDLGDVLNPNQAKRTWMQPAVRETFFEWEEGPAGLTITPLAKAPKWLQGLNDGEVVIGDTDV